MSVTIDVSGLLFIIYILIAYFGVYKWAKWVINRINDNDTTFFAMLFILSPVTAPFIGVGFIGWWLGENVFVRTDKK